MQTSQDFVRALKAASDPPLAGGSLKIQIAANVWNDSAFYVPRKGQLIAEWILNSMHRDKTGTGYVVKVFFSFLYTQYT